MPRLVNSCIMLLSLVLASPSKIGAEEKAAEIKLPASVRQLGEFLPNTVWDLKGGGKFRFRGDGTMVMPWHDFQWKATGARTADMFTKDWRFKITFSEDMTTLSVPDRYEGRQVKRILSALDDKSLAGALVAGKWTRVASGEKLPLSFNKHGKILDPEKVWKTWESHQGLLILRGTREGKDFKEEYLMETAGKPFTLRCIDGDDKAPKLVDEAA